MAVSALQLAPMPAVVFISMTRSTPPVFGNSGENVVINNLAAGTYTFFVQSIPAGCLQPVTVTIPNPPCNLAITDTTTVSASNTTCDNGSLTLTATANDCNGYSANIIRTSDNSIVGTAMAASGQPVTLNNLPAGSYYIQLLSQSGTCSYTSGVFNLSCSYVHTPPTLSAISDISSCQGANIAPLSFTVSDAETPADNLQISVQSDNTGLLPASNILLGGSGSERTLLLALLTGQSGAAHITITVTNLAGISSMSSFTVNIHPLSTPVLVIQPAGICVGQTVPLNGLPISGFTWSSDNAAVATVDQMGLVSGISAGYANISYDNPPDINGCNVSAHVIATINPLPFVAPITGNTMVYAGGTSQLGEESPGGIWSTDNVSVAAVDASGLLTAVTAGSANVFYTITNTSSCSASVSALVMVNTAPAPPLISAIADQIRCLQANPGAIYFSASDALTPADSLTYSATSDNSNVVDGGNIIFFGTGTNRALSIQQYGPGTALITITATDKAGLSSSTHFTLNVHPTVIPTLVIPPPNVCVGQSYPLVTPLVPGYIWVSNNLNVATVDQLGVVTAVSPGNANISVDYPPDPYGCNVSDWTYVTVNPLPPAILPITGNTSLYAGATSLLANASAGGIWSSDNTQVASVDVNGTVSGITPGTANISYTISNASSCSASVSTPVMINAVPAISPISGNSSVSVGTAITLSDATPGGTWSSDNASVATVDANGVVSGKVLGSANISYTVIFPGGASASATLGVIVINGQVPPAAPTITTLVGQQICENTSLNALPFIIGDALTPASNLQVTAGSDNTLLVSNSAIVINGNDSNRTITITPSIYQSGTANITITVTNAAGLNSSASFALTINPLPATAQLFGANYECVGSGTRFSVQLPNVIWASDDTSVAQILGSRVVGIGAGQAYISYTVQNAFGCKASVGKKFTVIALPEVPPITGNTTLYAGGSNLLSDGSPGGTWSSDNIGIATIDANGILYASNVGTANISYRLTNSNGCTSMVSALVTVNAVPAVAPITGNSIIPLGTGSSFSDITPGGSWSIDNTAVASVDANGLVSAISLGIANIQYTVTYPGGATSSATLQIGVSQPHTPPTITYINNQTTCYNTPSQAIAFTIGDDQTPPGNLVVSAVSDNPLLVPNASIAFDSTGANRFISITPYPGQSGSANITITVVNSAGLSSSTTFSFTVFPSIHSTIGGIRNICAGQTSAFFGSNPFGIWSSDNTGVASVDANGVVTGLSSGSANIIYTLTDLNACRVTDSALVTINSAPVVAPITGNNQFCIGSVITLTESTAGGVWSSSNSQVATVSSSGVVSILNAGTATVYYTVTNSSGCSTPAGITFSTTTLSVAPIAGSSTLCKGSLVTLADPTPGGLWTSSNAAVASINAAGQLTGLTLGTATISYTLSNGNGCTAVATLVVTVNAPPAVAAITGTTTFCQGKTSTLKDATTGGVWSSDNTAIATVSATGVVSGIAAGTAVINYTITNSSGCNATASKGITINALPVLAPILGASAVCVGSAQTLTDATAGGTWSSSNAAVATVSSAGVVNIIKTGAATISYSLTNSTGCSASASLTLTATSVTAAAITGTTTVCAGKTTALKDATAGGIWASSNPAIATVGTTGVVTGISAGTATITYSVTSASGCSAVASTSVTVNPTPVVAAISGSANVCTGSQVTLTDVTPGGVWSSSTATVATVSATGVVNVIKAGTATITYILTNTSGCIASTSLILTAKTVTAAAITGTTTLCAGATTTLKDATAGGLWSSSNTAVATVGVTGVVTGVSAGNATITYTVVSGVCAASASALVTVNALPTVAPVTGNNLVIAGNTITFSDLTTGGIWSSSKTATATVTAAGVVKGVAAGTATISYKVTSASGCSVTANQPLTVYGALTVSLAASKITCNAGSSTLSATTTGGSGSLQYVFNGNAPQSTNTLSVKAGAQTAVVTDLIDGQSVTKTLTITQPTALIWTLVSSVNASGGLSNGSISVTGSGGTAPLTYSIDGTHYQATGSFTALAAGSYMVYLRDANGCQTGITLNISTVVAAVTIPISDSVKLDNTDSALQSDKEDLSALVAPNPAVSQFNLDLKSSVKQNVEILVTDILGHTVYQNRGEATRQYQFGQGFAKGVYIIQVLHRKGIKVIKVIKQ